MSKKQRQWQNAKKFAVGDRVHFVGGDDKKRGEVVAEIGGRFFVKWDSGHQWPYAANDLEKEEATA